MPVCNQAILHPGAVIIYKSFPKNGKKKRIKISSLKNLVKGANGDYNGYLSPATTRKAKKMINCLLLGMKYSNKKRLPTMVTLTMPAAQQHDDYFIKREMFGEAFLKTMRRKYNVEHYFWRAEPQGNGNIHIHAIFDHAIPWQTVRGVWNSICAKHGYIEEYRANQLAKHKGGFFYNNSFLNSNEGMKFAVKRHKSYLRKFKRGTETGKAGRSYSIEEWEQERQLRAYRVGVKENWNNPNSTDIHALRGIRNVGAYVTKYMTKSPKELERIKELRGFLNRPDFPEFRTAWQEELEKLELKCRPIKGRLWGASDTLRGLKYFEEFVDSVDIDDNILQANPDIISYLDKLRMQADVVEKKVDDMVSVLLLKRNQEYYLRNHAPLIYQDYKNYYESIGMQLYP